MSQILTSVRQPEITDKTGIRPICVVNKTESAEYRSAMDPRRTNHIVQYEINTVAGYNTEWNINYKCNA